MVRLIILLTIIATICVAITKPQMHKPLMVYDSDYKIVTQTQADTKTTPSQDIPTVNQEVKEYKPQIERVEQRADVVFTPPKVKVEKIASKAAPLIKTEKVTSKTPTTVKVEKKEVPSSVKTIVEKYSNPSTVKVQEPVKTNVVQPKKVEEKKVVQQPVVKQETKPKQISQPQTQTVHLPAVQPTKTAAQLAREEEIAWNKWRSRLQNQIMADVRMPNIPYGVIFKFSFTVDKYGKISNVQTWSTTPNYTPHAIQYIAPVIRSYQGRAILNFPSGSNRVSTEVVGAWKISNSSKYSTPQDYNDTERVTR